MKRAMLFVPADPYQLVRPVRMPLFETRAMRRIRVLVRDETLHRHGVDRFGRDHGAQVTVFCADYMFGSVPTRCPNTRASSLARHEVLGDAVVAAVFWDGWYGDRLAGLSPEMVQRLVGELESKRVSA